jgi:hypothetical protein
MEEVFFMALHKECPMHLKILKTCPKGGGDISVLLIFDIHIKEDANILADGGSGYKPLKQEYSNLRQTLSEEGKNFNLSKAGILHIQIRNFKNWLRGVN